MQQSVHVKNLQNGSSFSLKKRKKPFFLFFSGPHFSGFSGPHFGYEERCKSHAKFMVFRPLRGSCSSFFGIVVIVIFVFAVVVIKRKNSLSVKKRKNPFFFVFFPDHTFRGFSETIFLSFFSYCRAGTIFFVFFQKVEKNEKK